MDAPPSRGRLLAVMTGLATVFLALVLLAFATAGRARVGSSASTSRTVHGAARVRVMFGDGHPAMPGTIIGTDGTRDIVVVEVDATDVGSNGRGEGRS